MATEKLGRNEIQSTDAEGLFQKLAAATAVGDRVTLTTLDAAVYSVKRVNTISESNRLQLAVDLESADGSVKQLSLEALRKSARSIEIDPRQPALVPAASGGLERRTIGAAEIERGGVEGLWNQLAYATGRNLVTLTTKDDRVYQVNNVAMTFATLPPKLAVELQSPNGRRETRNLDGLIKEIESIDIEPLKEGQRLPDAGQDSRDRKLEDKSSANQPDTLNAVERALQAMRAAPSPDAAIAAGVKALFGNAEQPLEAFLAEGKKQLAEAAQQQANGQQADGQTASKGVGRSR